MFPAPRRYAALLSTALLSTIAVPAMAEEVDDQASPAATIIVTARKDRDTLSDVSGTLIFAGKLGDVALLTDQPPVSGRNLRVALADIPGVLVS